MFYNDFSKVTNFLLLTFFGLNYDVAYCFTTYSTLYKIPFLLKFLLSEIPVKLILAKSLAEVELALIVTFPFCYNAACQCF